MQTGEPGGGRVSCNTDRIPVSTLTRHSQNTDQTATYELLYCPVSAEISNVQGSAASFISGQSVQSEKCSPVTRGHRAMNKDVPALLLSVLSCDERGEGPPGQVTVRLRSQADLESLFLLQETRESPGLYSGKIRACLIRSVLGTILSTASGSVAGDNSVTANTSHGNAELIGYRYLRSTTQSQNMMCTAARSSGSVTPVFKSRELYDGLSQSYPSKSTVQLQACVFFSCELGLNRRFEDRSALLTQLTDDRTCNRVLLALANCSSAVATEGKTRLQVRGGSGGDRQVATDERWGAGRKQPDPLSTPPRQQKRPVTVCAASAHSAVTHRPVCLPPPPFSSLGPGPCK
ncbi:hypothetical protein BaRGS_00006724 [Batillaria attramentaria]|uniref:Uncharacterized protein n=1 Tax=Batillaria attramentaria TaxID=370345 RepID=A0ABD0LSF2_9CAEN